MEWCLFLAVCRGKLYGFPQKYHSTLEFSFWWEKNGHVVGMASLRTRLFL